MRIERVGKVVDVANKIFDSNYDHTQGDYDTALQLFITYRNTLRITSLGHKDDLELRHEALKTRNWANVMTYLNCLYFLTEGAENDIWTVEKCLEYTKAVCSAVIKETIKEEAQWKLGHKPQQAVLYQTIGSNQTKMLAVAIYREIIHAVAINGGLGEEAQKKVDPYALINPKDFV